MQAIAGFVQRFLITEQVNQFLAQFLLKFLISVN